MWLGKGWDIGGAEAVSWGGENEGTGERMVRYEEKGYDRKEKVGSG